MRTAYTFDDISLITQYSEILPKDVNLSISYKNFNIKIPIISSPMDTVTNFMMAAEMNSLGGIGIVHKNYTRENLICGLKHYLPLGVDFGISISVNDLDLADELYNLGVRIICVDSAHGGHINVINTVKILRDKYPDLFIIAGNISSAECFTKLAGAGADMVKIGQGASKICSTRVVAGVGVPSLTAIRDCYEIKECNRIETLICADGGISKSGDIVKALAFGADCVMLGGLLAEAHESAANTEFGGIYRGMGSTKAMASGSAIRYNQECNSKFVPEGVEYKLKNTDSLENILHQLVGGIKSGFGYMGYKSIDDAHFKFYPEIDSVVVTNSGAVEALPITMRRE